MFIRLKWCFYCLFVWMGLINIWAQDVKALFHGNGAYTDPQLFAIIQKEWNEYLENKRHESYLHDAQRAIAAHYRKNGYYFISKPIKYTIEKDKVIFSLVENRQVLFRGAFLVNASPFKESHIKQSDSLLKAWKEQKDSIAKYLHSKLSPKFQKQLQKYQSGVSKEILPALIKELNKLCTQSLYQEKIFAKLNLAKNARRFLKIKAGKEELVLQNRFLLEKSYPKSIKTLLFSRKELRKFLTPPPTTGKRIFKKNQIEGDAYSVVAHYHGKNYLQVATSVYYFFSPKPPTSRRAWAVIAIKESPKAYLKELTFKGNKDFSTKKLKKLANSTLEELKKNSKEPKDVYIKNSEQNVVSVFSNLYRENGYAQIDIRIKKSHKVDKKKNKVIYRIILFIKEGKKNYIGKIRIAAAPAAGEDEKAKAENIFEVIKEGKKDLIDNIKGDDQELFTDPNIILQRLEIRTGDLYKLSKLVQSARNINNTKLYKSIEFKETYVKDDQVDITILVVEKEPDDGVLLKLGYSTSFGVVIGFSYENINVSGTGLRFITGFETSLGGGDIFRSEANARFIDPFLYDPWNLEGEVGVFGIFEEGTPTFDTFLEYGIEIVARKFFIQDRSTEDFRSILKGEFGYRFTLSEVTLATDNNIDNDEEDLIIFSTPFQKLELDLRNNFVYPTEGTHSFIELEESLRVLGSDVDYFKFYLHTAWYIDLKVSTPWSELPLVLALSFRGGVIVPFDGSEVPRQRRFFSGGASSVRSFKEREMPPLDAEDNPIGGEGLFLVSTELRVPVYGNLGFSGFVDVGEVIETVRAVNEYRVSQVKYGIGFGIWYNIEILGAAVRFDIAFNPDPEENPLTGEEEDDFNFFISIGFSF